MSRAIGRRQMGGRNGLQRKLKLIYILNPLKTELVPQAGHCTQVAGRGGLRRWSSQQAPYRPNQPSGGRKKVGKKEGKKKSRV